MHGRYKGLLFLLSVFLLWCARSRAEEMMLTVPAKIHPFVECTIRLTLPEDGVLTIGVTDGYGVQKPLAEQQPVQEGELEIPYDGCSFEGMPLMSGTCIFSVELLGESGTVRALLWSMPCRVHEYIIRSRRQGGRLTAA